jgi:hypothetical protein
MFLRGIDGAGVRGRTRTEDREVTEDFSNGLIDRGGFWAAAQGDSPSRRSCEFLLPRSNGLSPLMLFLQLGSANLSHKSTVEPSRPLLAVKNRER